MHSHRVAGAVARHCSRTLARLTASSLHTPARAPVLRAAACGQPARLASSTPPPAGDGHGTDAGDGPTVDWEAFRTQGKQLVDFVCDYYQNIESHPVRSQVKPGYLHDALPKEAPETPEQLNAVLDDVMKHIMPGITHWQHPRFFAFYPANTSPPAMLGDMLSGMFGVIAFSWVASPAATELETIVMDWLGKALQLPTGFLSSGKGGGVIQGTASEATLVAVLAAREKAIRERRADPSVSDGEYAARLVVYCCDQSHSSVQKAANIAGIRTEHVRVLKADAEAGYSLPASLLADTIAQDKEAGLVPMACIATSGTTTSCAFDDIDAIGRVCNDAGLWLHVDAAYAGAAAICPEFRHALNGVERASSVAVNAHKWLLTSFDFSAMWVQDRSAIIDALSLTPPYLRSREYDEGLVSDYRDWQVPLGRRFRSLKLWMVLRMYGLDGLRHHIRRHCLLAQTFADKVRADDRFELAVEPALGLVCFRVSNASDEQNEAVLEALNASGTSYMVSSQLGGQTVLRCAIGGGLTTRKHIDEVWASLCDAADAVIRPSAKL